MKSSLCLMFAVFTACASLAARADDWPQYGGPGRDAVSHETGLLKSWPAEGPKLLWSLDNLGLGYSGPAIVGNRLYISCGRDRSEYVIALDLSGASSASPPKELWATKIGPLFTWTGNNWNIGPNVAPTVDGECLYALGGNGDLACVETATGKVRWQKSMPRDLAGEVNPIGGGAEEPTPLGWGYAWAPLVDGDQLICVPGGKQGLLASLDKKTGATLWRSKEVIDQAPYASPRMVNIGGVRQIVQVVNSGIVGVAAADGHPLWTYHRQPAYDDVVVATPVIQDNYIFSSVGFGQGCDLIKLAARGEHISVEKIFSNKSIQSRNGGMVLVEGHVYGYSESRGWICMELTTGKIAWSDREQLGRGSILAADGLLYCCAEKGGVIALLQANPAARTEVSRFTLPRESEKRPPSGGLWTHPVIADKRLYIRDEEYLYCYDVAGGKS